MKIIITVKPDVNKKEMIEWIDNIQKDNVFPWMDKIELMDKIIKCKNPCNDKENMPCCYFCESKNNCDKKCDYYIENGNIWETCEDATEE
jgi:hypothetical protein